MKDERDEKQNEVVSSYIDSAEVRSTLVLPTGYGKSFVAMKILKHYKPKNILILVNSQILRDDNWKEEFLKFDMEDVYTNNVTLQTYQKVYKWTKEKHPLEDYFIIADEVDFAANTDKLSKFFSEYSTHRILGLTGFITISKREWFSKNLPVIREITTEHAEDIGLLNKTRFLFIKFPMTEQESNLYMRFEKQLASFTKMEEESALLLMQSKINITQHMQKLKSIEFKTQNILRKRARYLNQIPSSVAYAKKVIDIYLAKSKDNKIIVFSKTTEQSGLITENVYNGTKSAKENRQIFSNFNSSAINVLGVVSKINRGVNIKNLNVGIWESYYGSDTQFIQQNGRLKRLDPSTYATAVLLLPYYLDKDKLYVETQKVRWARKMLRTTKVRDSKVVDYTNV